MGVGVVVIRVVLPCEEDEVRRSRSVNIHCMGVSGDDIYVI